MPLRTTFCFSVLLMLACGGESSPNSNPSDGKAGESESSEAGKAGASSHQLGVSGSDDTAGSAGEKNQGGSTAGTQALGGRLGLGGSSPEGGEPSLGGTGIGGRGGATGTGGEWAAGGYSAGGAAAGGRAAGGAATGGSGNGAEAGMAGEESGLGGREGLGGSGSGGAANGGVSTTLIAKGGSGGEPFCETILTAGSAGVATIDSISASVGTFENHCDSSGNLVEYRCHVLYIDDPNCAATGSQTPVFDGSGGTTLAIVAPPYCDTIPVATGNVFETITDCAGECHDGVCDSKCPEYGDSITYLSIDRETGAATFEFPRVGQELSCELLFDSSADGYDCTLDPEPGREVSIPSTGLSSSYCLVGPIGNIGVDDPTYERSIHECSYGCSVIPSAGK